MPDANSDELSLYFHIDPRLAQGRNSFHFHVLLEDGPTPHRRETHGGDERPKVVDIECCIPPEGNRPQKVRDTGSGSGKICVVGRGTVDGRNPSKIKAKIYGTGLGAGAGPDPPSGDSHSAQMINFDTHPNFHPTECIGLDDPNFAFHHTFDNELPGASHSSMGVNNEIVLWMYDSGRWHKCNTVWPFKGISAYTTECTTTPSGSGSRPPAVASALAALKGPKKLHVVSPGPSPKAGGNLTLHRVGPESASLITWRSCPQANPECSWKLWLTANAGKPFATLVLLSLDGKRLPVPLVWKCAVWNADAENVLTFSSPHGSKQAGTVALVVPV